MKDKGQVEGIGIVLYAFIGIVVALLLYTSIGQIVGDSTGANPVTKANYTIVAPASGSTLDLPGQELINVPVVTNRTDGIVISTGNYSIYEGVGSSGSKAIIYKSLSTQFAGKNVNISYQYYPDGYIDDAGARSLALLIPVLAALAIAVIALVPALRNGVMDLMKK